MGCLFAAYQNGTSSHTFTNVHFDQHRSGILVPLSTGVLEEVEVLGLCDSIQLDGYDLLLCLMAFLFL